MQRIKRGNPHHLPKKRKRGRQAPAPNRQQRASSTVAQLVDSLERARLTLHDRDPITGNEDTLSALLYECYRGYTIYSTQEGRCCIHGKQGCIRLRGKFVCFPDVEEAKTLIKRFRAEGYSSYDGVERHLPAWGFVCLNRGEHQHALTGAHCMERVAERKRERGDDHIFPSHKEE